MATPPLQLFNSLGRTLQNFVPIDARRVRVYSCGPTVYNYAHLGNLRAYLCMDTLRRVLQWKGYDVFHVINITDVGHLTSDADEGEDKVELAAGRTGRTVWELTRDYATNFKQSLARLNILRPALWSKATDHILEMIAFAQVLDRAGATYELGDGLYFDTSKVPQYGELGLLDLAQQREGARIEVKSDKRNASDFAVWRKSPPDKQRLMEWDSPWGKGCPGWHLECSVMSGKYLGMPFDIHTGGVDHRQVHHVNEIAQNQAYAGTANSGATYWLHNEFLVLRDDAKPEAPEKMAKSADNFLRLETLLEWGIHPLVYRFFNLQAHYRSQLEFNLGLLIAARATFERIVRRVRAIGATAGALLARQIADEARFTSGGSFDFIRERLIAPLSPAAREHVDKFDEAISCDLATPRAIAQLIEVGSDRRLAAEDYLRVVAVYDLVFGLNLLTLDPAELNLRPVAAAFDQAEVERLVALRQQARRAKDYAQSDALRDQLVTGGVQINDKAEAGEASWTWLPRKP